MTSEVFSDFVDSMILLATGWLRTCHPTSRYNPSPTDIPSYRAEITRIIDTRAEITGTKEKKVVSVAGYFPFELNI